MKNKLSTSDNYIVGSSTKHQIAECCSIGWATQLANEHNSHQALVDALAACEAALAEVPCISNKQEAARIQARLTLKSTHAS